MRWKNGVREKLYHLSFATTVIVFLIAFCPGFNDRDGKAGTEREGDMRLKKKF